MILTGIVSSVELRPSMTCTHEALMGGLRTQMLYALGDGPLQSWQALTSGKRSFVAQLPVSPSEVETLLWSVALIVLLLGVLLGALATLVIYWTRSAPLATDRLSPRDRDGMQANLLHPAQAAIADGTLVLEQDKRDLNTETGWQLALADNNDGLWDLDIATNQVVRSPRWFEILGYKPDELSSSNDEWANRLHPDDFDRVMQADQDYLKRQIPHHVLEYRLRCKDGTYKWVQSRSQALWNAQGQPVRLVGSLWEITDPKQAAFTESEARYCSVVGSMAEGVVLQDAQGMVCASNLSAAEILGLSIEQIMGRSPLDPHWKTIREDGSPFPIEEHPGFITLKTGKPCFEVIMGIHKPEGRLTWISINTQPLFHLHEVQPYAVVWSFSDISLRKEAEAVLQQKVQQEQALSRVIRDIRNSLDLTTVFSTATAEIAELLGADVAEIVQWQSNEDWQLVASYCRTIDRCHCPCRHQPLTLSNSPTCAHLQARLLVPLHFNTDLWGNLRLVRSQPQGWQPAEIELAYAVADQLAIAISQSELYRQLQVANQKLEQLAVTDALTQVANRRYFDSYIQQEWQRSRREQAPLGLILVDIDFFKPYNDTYGHQAGDVCLHQVAQAIRQAVKRPADLVARYGGEEFAIVLPNTPEAGVTQIAQDIQTAVYNLQLPHLCSTTGRVTVSLGAVCCVFSPARSLFDWVSKADQALYDAKAAGRNCFRLHSTGPIGLALI